MPLSTTWQQLRHPQENIGRTTHASFLSSHSAGTILQVIATDPRAQMPHDLTHLWNIMNKKT